MDARAGKRPYPAGRTWDFDALPRCHRLADIDRPGGIADRDRAIKVGAGPNCEVIARGTVDELGLSSRSKKQRGQHHQKSRSACKNRGSSIHELPFWFKVTSASELTSC